MGRFSAAFGALLVIYSGRAPLGAALLEPVSPRRGQDAAPDAVPVPGIHPATTSTASWPRHQLRSRTVGQGPPWCTIIGFNEAPPGKDLACSVCELPAGASWKAQRVPERGLTALLGVGWGVPESRLVLGHQEAPTGWEEQRGPCWASPISQSAGLCLPALSPGCLEAWREKSHVRGEKWAVEGENGQRILKCHEG